MAKKVKKVDLAPTVGLLDNYIGNLTEIQRDCFATLGRADVIKAKKIEDEIDSIIATVEKGRGYYIWYHNYGSDKDSTSMVNHCSQFVAELESSKNVVSSKDKAIVLEVGKIDAILESIIIEVDAIKAEFNAWNATDLDEATRNVQKATGGTLEAKAQTELGKERRMITGDLEKHARLKNFKNLKKTKWLSIIISAFGFLLTIQILRHQPIHFEWSSAPIYTLGLLVGLFFEWFATSFEFAFVKDVLDDDAITHKTKKMLLIIVKLYAVTMHMVTAYNLPTFINMQNMADVDDNYYITSRLDRKALLLKDRNSSSSSVSTVANMYKTEIAKLDASIKKLTAEQDEYRENSRSKNPRKAQRAKDEISNLQDTIDRKDREKATYIEKQAKSMTLSPKQVIDTEIISIDNEVNLERIRLKQEVAKQSKSSSTIGLSIFIGFLFIIIEISGTYAAISIRQLLIENVTIEEAYHENVTNSLFSRSVAQDERNNRMKALKITYNLKNSHMMGKLSELESNVNNHNYQLIEEAKIAQMRNKNSELTLNKTLQDVEANNMLNLAEATAQKVATSKQIDVRIVRFLE